jgi:hypothetical protein
MGSTFVPNMGFHFGRIFTPNSSFQMFLGFNLGGENILGVVT